MIFSIYLKENWEKYQDKREQKAWVQSIAAYMGTANYYFTIPYQSLMTKNWLFFIVSNLVHNSLVFAIFKVGKESFFFQDSNPLLCEIEIYLFSQFFKT